jgi:hypothetical protein
VKAIEQMFVCQASFLYVALQARDAPSVGPGPTPPRRAGRIKKGRGFYAPAPDHYFFFAAFLTFFTAFFTAFLTFFLAAIVITSFY